MIQDLYIEETGKDPHCKDYTNPSGKYNDDYVHWLERNAEKQVKNIKHDALLARASESERKELLVNFLMEIDECYGMHVRKDAEKCADDYLKLTNGG